MAEFRETPIGKWVHMILLIVFLLLLIYGTNNPEPSTTPAR